METVWKKNIWQRATTDVFGLALGAFLFLTPWVFAFSEPAASWNAWLSGITIAGLAVAALAAYAAWEEWLSLFVGLWVAASPWLVGFLANSLALHLHLVIGILVAVLAAARLWFAHHPTQHVTA